MMMKKFSVSEDVLAAVIGYIQSRPFKEVQQLMTILQSDLKFIGEEDVDRPEAPVEAPTFVEEETQPDKEEEKPKKKSKKK